MPDWEGDMASERRTEKMNPANGPGRRGARAIYLRSPRLGALIAVAFGLAACGGASPNSVAHIPTTASPATTVPAASSSMTPGSSGPAESPSAPGDITSQLLTFARCMRSNGAPNFPDPSGGGFSVPPGGEHSSPAFKAAEAKCQKYLPPGPGSGPPPSPQALAQMLKVARCMRRLGISDFPDPRTKAPSDIIGFQGIVSDIDGVILVFPSTINQQSPAFVHAAAACKFPLHNH